MPTTGDLPAGTLVAGRYLIQEPLAGEGSGAVYRADDTRLDRAVALRALPSDQAGGAQQGKAAARLVHPNVARVLDFGTDTGLGLEFVVADLGTGGSLAALLAQRGVPPLALASRMVQEAAAGMAAAHRAGLVHGDLHPGVLWLSRDEGRLRVQVLGLGLNPAGSAPPRSTARYASPERLRRARELSSAADVFSLGVIAYEVFAGLPADWNQRLLAMARGQAVVAPSLLESRPDLPAHVAHAVRRAMVADPSSRWPDAGELAAHLIADLAAQPAEAPAPVRAAAPAPEPAPAASAREPVAAFLADLGADAEAYDDEVPVMDAEASIAEAEVPVMNAEAPVMNFATSTVEAELPVMEAQAPVMGAEASTVEAEAPVMEVAALATDAPVIEAEVPMMEVAALAPAPALEAAPDAFADAAAPSSQPEPTVELEPIATEATPVEIPALAPAAEPVVAPVAVTIPVDAIAALASTEPQEVIATPADAAPAAETVAASADAAVSATPDAAPELLATASEAAAAKPSRQPFVAGRRAKPIALASTDLADTLYIPPALEKPAPREQPTASAEKPAQTPAAKPTEAPARTVVAPPAPVAAAPVSEKKPTPGPVVAAVPAVSASIAPEPEETLLAPAAIPADAAPAADEAVIPITTERRRKRGMAGMGQPEPGNRRAMLAAGIVVAVLVAGGVVARTVLAGGSDAQVPVVANSLASRALAAAGSAPAPGQPQAAVTDSAVPGATDSAALPDPALTPEQQRKQEEDRKRLEEQRRLQLRQQDSLRRAQLAAQPAAAQPTVLAGAPQQVAVAPVQRAVESAPAPRVEQPAPSAPAPAPTAAPERPRADPNRVYGGDELDTRPSLANGSQFRSAVQRTYPGTLRGSGQWGSAVVSFVVLPDGRVDRSSVTVVEASQPAFRGAASAAISNARFNPARVGGQAVRAQVSMPITWQGDGRDDD